MMNKHFFCCCYVVILFSSIFPSASWWYIEMHYVCANVIEIYVFVSWKIHNTTNHSSCIKFNVIFQFLQLYLNPFYINSIDKVCAKLFFFFLLHDALEKKMLHVLHIIYVENDSKLCNVLTFISIRSFNGWEIAIL